ncbi:MAG: ABC transporter substrate-binding protein [Chloroflexi bacterium]|nr:ABC transporter substrate-binding protein [Chloroflexota bacterium]
MSQIAVAFLGSIMLAAAACAGQPPSPVAPAVAVSVPTPTTLAATPITRTIHCYTLSGLDIRDVPFLMALDSLKAQGYTIDAVDVSSSSLAAAALARGDADIASFNNQTAWDAIAKGTPVRTIMGRYVTSPLIGATQAVKTCADLDGKSVALSGTTGVSPALFNEYVKQTCPGSKPQIVVIASAPTRSAALLSGNVDAAQIESQDAVELDRTAPGRFHTLVALAKVFPQVQSGGIHARVDWANQNADVVKDFVRALLFADRKVNDNPQVLYDESVKRLGIDPEVAKQAGEIQFGYNTWDRNGGLTAENIQSTLDFLGKIDPTLNGLHTQDVADLSYLSEVLDEIGRK